MSTSNLTFMSRFRLSTYFIFILLVSFFIISCNNPSSNEESKIEADSGTIPSGAPESDSANVISPTLKLLYLENFIDGSIPGRHNQLQVLRDKHDKKVQKLVFTFFHSTSNELTLGAWGSLSGKDHNEFDPDAEILHTAKTMASSIDITGKEIFLGNFEIGNGTSQNKKFLRVLFSDTVVNQSKYKYIILKPRINGKTIIYDLSFTKDIAEIEKATFAYPRLSDISANPSPPKDAY